MKITLAICAILIAYPAKAISFHAPHSPQEINEFQKAQNNLSQIKRLNDLLGDKKNPPNATEATDYRQQQILLYNATIQSVIAAYGIRPEHITGTLVIDGELKGQKATWDPVFGEMKSREFKDYNGVERTLQPLNGASAMTYVDGQIIIGKDFFTESPAFLAAGIIHETTHFEQFTTSGQGACQAYDPTCELEAYKVELSAIKTLGLTPHEVLRIGKGMKDEMSKIYLKPWLIPAFILNAPKPRSDIERTKNDAENSFLNSWKTEATPVIRNAQNQAFADKFSKEHPEFCVPITRCGGSPQAESSPHNQLKDALKEWTQTACDYITPAEYVDIPEDPTVSNFGRPGVALGMPDQSFLNSMTDAAKENNRRAKEKEEDDQNDRDYLLNHLVVMSRADIEEFKSEDASLTQCQIEMADLLSEANGPVDAQWMIRELDVRKRQEINKNRDPLDVLLHKLVKAIPIATAYIVRGITAPFIAIGNAVTIMPSGNSSNGNNGSSGNSNFHYNDGRAAHQLRGIASGGMSFDSP